MFAPSIQEGTTVDVKVVRERTDIVADLARNQPFSLKLNYQREQRHGSGGLSSNYLSYQTETPQVTEYLTQDFGLAGALDQSWGNVRGALHYNWYQDQAKSLLFDSPFRATDALVATVGTGAAATAVGGPTQGRMINPPDNQAYLGSFGTTLKLPNHTRITGDVNMSHLTQNDQFFPYLTNTAVVTPVLAAQTSSLPAQSLNGKMNTTGIVFAITSKPVDALNLAVRYRRLRPGQPDAADFVPRLRQLGSELVGLARASTCRTATRTTAWTRRPATTSGKVTFEGGFRRTTIDRTFRETEQTAENTGTVAVVVHAMDNQANLRAMYEKGSRDYSGLELGRSEDASFVVAPTGLSANALGRDGSLRFDQSKRSSDRAGIVMDISPVSRTTLAFTYLHNKDTYSETVYGLQNASYDTYTAEVSVSPSEQWNVTGYYSHEKNGSSQVNNGTSNFPTIDMFTVNLNDDVDTAGVSSVFTLVPNKATLNLSGRYQNLKGTAGFVTNPGSSYQLARASMGGVKDIPNADNAKLTRVDLSVDCTLTQKVTLTLGTWYEDYAFSDVDSSGAAEHLPRRVLPGAERRQLQRDRRIRSADLPLVARVDHALLAQCEDAQREARPGSPSTRTTRFSRPVPGSTLTPAGEQYIRGRRQNAAVGDVGHREFPLQLAVGHVQRQHRTSRRGFGPVVDRTAAETRVRGRHILLRNPSRAGSRQTADPSAACGTPESGAHGG